MAAKLEAQRQAIGIGFLPWHLAKPALESGALIQKALCFTKTKSRAIYRLE